MHLVNTDFTANQSYMMLIEETPVIEYDQYLATNANHDSSDNDAGIQQTETEIDEIVEYEFFISESDRQFMFNEVFIANGSTDSVAERTIIEV